MTTLRYFSLTEFACRHCGLAQMHDGFLRRLDDLRHTLGAPLVVTSGYRCPIHNQAVSSSGPNGPHTTGRAADLRVHGGTALRLVALAEQMGFTGVGVRQHGPQDGRYVHLDDLPAAANRPRPWMWSYS